MKSGCVFDLPGLETEITRLSEESQQPGFWDDSRSAQSTMRRLTALQNQAEQWRSMSQRANDRVFGEEIRAVPCNGAAQPLFMIFPPGLDGGFKGGPADGE